MATKTINAEMLAKMFLAGAGNIEAKKEYINELNVFPVPDGDTGTNMSLTIMAAAKEVSAIEKLDMTTLAKAISSGSLRGARGNSPDGDTGTNMSLTIMAAAKEVSAIEKLDMTTLAKAISSGSLRGARGNSGVILSQLFRGFTKAIKEHKEIDVTTLAAACVKAKETAYKAVMKPKEGTILTVARGIAEKAEELSWETEDLEEFIPQVLAHAEEVLQKTPEMLPVLKEAGVVDSGGQGLLEVLKGAYDAFLGKEIDYKAIAPSKGAGVTKISAETNADIKFGYCTEFIILTEKEFTEDDERGFKAYLESIGDSIVCVADDEIVKVHVHTNDPGLAIQRALTFGQLSRMKIDNMREEHEEKLIRDAEKLAAEEAAKKQEEPRKEMGFIAVSIGEGMNEIFMREEHEEKLIRDAEKLAAEEAAKKQEEPRKEMGFIAVSIGEGMNEIFRELGVDYIIEGGQTMNPSTEDMLAAIDAVHAEHIFILPNNKNIVMAAKICWQQLMPYMQNIFSSFRIIKIL